MEANEGAVIGGVTMPGRKGGMEWVRVRRFGSWEGDLDWRWTSFACAFAVCEAAGGTGMQKIGRI